ncbi:MAG: glycoside hydrolase domain-containing protein [Crocinitomicaceae bacterium]
MNIYVQDVVLNGRSLKSQLIKHSDLLQGGELIFKMNNKAKY